MGVEVFRPRYKGELRDVRRITPLCLRALLRLCLYNATYRIVSQGPKTLEEYMEGWQRAYEFHDMTCKVLYVLFWGKMTSDFI